MKKHAWKILIATSLLLMVASFWYAGVVAKKSNEGIEIKSHVKGNVESTVVLTEYSDFQCPACQAAAAVVGQVMEKYGDQLRFEYKHFPLVTIHKNAVAAGVASEAAAQQGKFFEMHDKLFAEQKVWGASASPNVYFIQYATEIGLDVTKFKSQLGSSALEQQVRSGFNAARELGFTGTPTFLLNGQKMDFSSYEDFMAQIEGALGITTTQEVTESPEVQFGI